jgi:FkbM family methyltransferase
MIARFLKGVYKRNLFNLSARNSGLLNVYYRYFYRPKKGSISEVLDLFSQQKSPVCFLQVGANDGFFHDPLHKFIKMYGWKGVLLEPQPFVFNQFLSRLYDHVPDVVPVNAALDYADGERSIYKIAFSNSRWATGLTSFSRTAIEEAIASGHVDRCAKRYGENAPPSHDDYIKEEVIKCISPETLFDKYKLQKIDWLQIDAEGYDFEIIKMLKIAECAPKVIVFEHSHLCPEDYAKCTDLLRGQNYALSRIHENTLAMKHPLPDSFLKFFPAEEHPVAQSS